MRARKGAARNKAKKRLFRKVEGFVGGRRRLLRTAIRVSDGREVDARADEMFAVFARAEGALAAALESLPGFCSAQEIHAELRRKGEFCGTRS